MKFLLVGHSVLDNIITGDEKVIKPGGLYYSTAAMNAIIAEDDKLYLCTSMEEELYSYFEKEYSRCNTSYVQYGSKIPRVNLFLNPGQERCEKYENINSALNIPYEELNNFDAILLNMITGFDISLEQLRGIRKHFKGVIYMDVHTLSRGLDANMQRVFRRIRDFNEWKQHIDIIQVNEHEIFTISREREEVPIARDILLNKEGQLPSQLVLTLGQLGAKVYSRRDDEVKAFFKSAVPVQLFNIIGLGDTFGAVYFYTYLKTKSFYKALEMAVEAGAAAASSEGLVKLKTVKNVLY